MKKSRKFSVELKRNGVDLVAEIAELLHGTPGDDDDESRGTSFLSAKDKKDLLLALLEYCYAKKKASEAPKDADGAATFTALIAELVKKRGEAKSS